jgi:hypothetical protein
VSEAIGTVAEALKRDGYATLSVVANDFAGRAYGLGQGFELVDESHVPDSQDTSTSRRLVETALAHVARTAKRPFFLWIHFFDPHFQYMRHERFGFAAPYLPHLVEGSPSRIISLEFLGPRGRNPMHRHLITPAFQDFVRAVYDEEIAESSSGNEVACTTAARSTPSSSTCRS